MNGFNEMLDLASNYAFGENGFPKNPLRAIGILTEFKRKAQNYYEEDLTDDLLNICYRSTEYYEKEAQDGNAIYQYLLGMRYWKGESGVKKNVDKACYWLTKSAEQDNGDAQFALGQLYYSQTELEQNKYIANSWLLRAVAHGGKNVGQAMFLLAEIYDKDNILQNKSQALYWYSKAAECGDIYAQYQLGLLYYQGTYVNQNVQYAAMWLEKAALGPHFIHLPQFM